MRSWGTLVFSIVICAALIGCATVPKSYQPQPIDHAKAQATHLYYAFVSALLETDREVLRAYMDDKVLYMRKEQNKPELISGSVVLERFGEHFGKYPSNDFGSMELIKENDMKVLTREEMLKMGDDCPVCIKNLRDYLKDGDILVSGATDSAEAQKLGLAENIVMAFRKVDKKTHLVAIMMN